VAAGRFIWCHQRALRLRDVVLDNALSRAKAATAREKPVVRTNDSAAGVTTDSTRS
jgi:hypothetical protein